MSAEKREILGQEGSPQKWGYCGYDGKKMLLGALIGLVLVGAGFGLYHVGKYGGKVCPVNQTQQK